MKHIAYPNPDSTVSIVFVTDAVPLEENARQSVPYDVPYVFIDESELPKNKEERAAFHPSFEHPDGVGADYGVGTPWAVVAYQDGIAAIAINTESGDYRWLNGFHV